MYPETPLRIAFVNQQCRRSWTVGLGIAMAVVYVAGPAVIRRIAKATPESLLLILVPIRVL